MLNAFAERFLGGAKFVWADIDEYRMMEREERITNLRAISILIVVLGHSIIIYSDSWNLYHTINNVPILNILKKVINLIQMPLFFSLSGYLFGKKINKYSFAQLVTKKTKRLLIPYLFVSCFWLLPIRIIIRFWSLEDRGIKALIWENIILQNDNGHLWFLPCIFMCFMLSFLTYKSATLLVRTQNHYYAVAVTYFVSLCVYILRWKILELFYVECIYNIFMYWVWFNFGMIINCCHELVAGVSIGKARNYLVGILCVGILLAKFIYSIPDIIVSAVIVLTFYTLMPNKPTGLLKILGENSFGIYLFHSPLIYITYSTIPDALPIKVVFINFWIFGCMALLLTVAVKNSKFKFIIGEF